MPCARPMSNCPCVRPTCHKMRAPHHSCAPHACAATQGLSEEALAGQVATLLQELSAEKYWAAQTESALTEAQ
eukprot:6357314-Prymnesium_polylepis.1